MLKHDVLDYKFPFSLNDVSLSSASPEFKGTVQPIIKKYIFFHLSVVTFINPLRPKVLSINTFINLSNV